MASSATVSGGVVIRRNCKGEVSRHDKNKFYLWMEFSKQQKVKKQITKPQTPKLKPLTTYLSSVTPNSRLCPQAMPYGFLLNTFPMPLTSSITSLGDATRMAIPMSASLSKTSWKSKLRRDFALDKARP